MSYAYILPTKWQAAGHTSCQIIFRTKKIKNLTYDGVGEGSTPGYTQYWDGTSEISAFEGAELSSEELEHVFPDHKTQPLKEGQFVELKLSKVG